MKQISLIVMFVCFRLTISLSVFLSQCFSFFFPAVKTKNVVTLGINDFFVEPFVGSQGSDATDTRHPLYVGGHPKPHELRGAETTEQFVGCIKNLAIVRDNRNIAVSLTAARSYGSVISNVCPTI